MVYGQRYKQFVMSGVLMLRSTAARPLDRTSPLPLWAQLLEELRRRLQAGAFPDVFPGEMDLVAEYEVSRHTVREALRRLREEGVLDSSRGRGTVVRRTAIEQPLGSIYSLFRRVESQGMTQQSIVLGQGRVEDPTAATALGLPGDTELFHLERIRCADGAPLAHDQVWLPWALASPLAEADFTHAALYDELAARCAVHITQGRELISAIVPSAAQRAQLAVPRGGACFAIERTGSTTRATVEHRRSVIRADAFSLLAEWSPHGYSLNSATSHRD
jgi:GntR family transcriptional regulator